MKKTYFYRDKPIFGLSLGFNDLRIMQVKDSKHGPEVQAYGCCTFDPAALKDGVIIDINAVAKTAKELLQNGITGKITTRRVIVSIPASRTFSRAVKLPKLGEKELNDAVRLEAEQYIPLPIDDLYLDHTVIAQNETDVELFAVAAPKNIIDSYVALTKMLDLEVVAIETTIDSAARLFSISKHDVTPTVLIDFGPNSVDITIFDNVILATGTVSGGGESFTERIANYMGVSAQEAQDIKGKYGLSYSDKQTQITKALDPILEQFFKEVQRMIRYYEERYPKRQKISQVVLMGSGAGIPGLSEHMTDALRLPVRPIEPWQTVTFGSLKPPEQQESLGYMSAAGAAMISPKGLYQ